MQHDGIDGCWTISTAKPTGARTPTCTPTALPHQHLRQQLHPVPSVSDARPGRSTSPPIREPIRNFGVGGFGVYQAYRRMLRAEKSDLGAKYVILYIWATTTAELHALPVRGGVSVVAVSEGKPFHANFWPVSRWTPNPAGSSRKRTSCPPRESVPYDRTRLHVRVAEG